MVKLAEAFRNLHPFKVLVLGDFMLDTYTTGKVKRVSPEAPVPVLEVVGQESRPGGAGNVVLGLTELGAEVFAMGRIGADDGGRILKSLLHEANCDFLFVEDGYQTPVKNRLVANSQQLLRMDTETVSFLKKEVEERVLAFLEEIISSVNVVALSDYGKGFLTHRVIQETLALCKKRGIPSIVDPKGSDFSKYRGSFVLKPNLSEAYAAAKLASSHSLEEVAFELKSFTEHLLITRSEMGISIFHKSERTDISVRSKEVKDVTGAGDTVLCLICLGLANGLDVATSSGLANIAAGIAIEKVGCVQVSLSEIAQRLLGLDSESKIFEEKDTYALHQVLKGKQYSLLVLEEAQNISPSLFKTIRTLAKKDEELIIYVKNSFKESELVFFLSSLNEVDYIILQSESLKHLCEAIHPQEVHLLKQDEKIKIEIAKNIIHDLSRQFA